MPKSKEKALEMMRILQEVADSGREVGYPRQADELLKAIDKAIKPLVEKGNYEDIYKLCQITSSRNQDMNDKIEKRGGKSLGSELPRTKEIYSSS